MSRDDLEAGWLHGALRIALPSNCGGARLEFRIGEEHASLAGDEIVEGGIEDPDAVIVGDARGFYRLLVDRELDEVTIDGDVEGGGPARAASRPCRRPSSGRQR